MPRQVRSHRLKFGMNTLICDKGSLCQNIEVPLLKAESLAWYMLPFHLPPFPARLSLLLGSLVSDHIPQGKPLTEVK